MEKKHYDILIIGAGPAGMGAAITLAKQHANVCVLDKAIFPRSKTCAGLVTDKTYRLIESLYAGDTDDLFCCTSDTIRLFLKKEQLTESTLAHPVRLVNRSHFDNALVEEFKRLGGEIREGEKPLSVDYAAQTVALSDGSTIHYDHLLFADGALSMAHKLLNVDRRKLAFGVEAYVPADRLPVKSIDLGFGYLSTGYVWTFPHGDTVCVGIADQYSKFTDYRAVLDGYLTDLGVDPKGLRYIGAFLPYGEVVPQEKLPDSVMLLGDAGGFTDPISGEGLYMALQTGVYAANALQSPSPKSAYLESLKPLIRIIKDGKKVQKTFYSAPVQKLFLGKVKGKNNLVAYFFENMVEDYRYDYRDLHRLYKDYKSR